MSNSVDNRVVQMEFDNASFERGVAQSIATLQALHDTITDLPSNTNFNDVFGKIENGAVSRISKIKEAASGAISTVINGLSAIGSAGVGLDRIKAFASGGIIGQMLEGGKARALKIEQAKFQIEGLIGSAKEFKAQWPLIEQSINKAVDGTRYGYDSAAKAASQLMASNVALGEEMTNALRAISGVASMTNSEYDDMADIFTRVAGQGRVMANDLNSIAARGLNAAATLAKALNVTEAEVRDMVSKGDIDFKTFATAMNDAFGEQATKANDTFTGAMSNMKAALNRIGAEFFVTTKQVIDGKERVVGGLDSMRRIFVAMIPVLNGIKMAMAPIFEAWREATFWSSRYAVRILNTLGKIFYKTEEGGKVTGSVIADLGKIFSNVFAAIKSYVKPLTEAFSTISLSFPKFKVIQEVVSSILAPIIQLTEHLKLTAEESEMLTNILTPLAQVVSFVAKLVGGALYTGLRLVSQAMMVVRDAVGYITAAVHNLLNGGLRILVAILEVLGDVATSVFSKLEKIFVKSNFGKFIGTMVDGIKNMIDALTSNGLFGILLRFGLAFRAMRDELRSFVKGLSEEGSAFKPFMTALNYVLRTYGSIRRIVEGYLRQNVLGDFVDGLVDKIKAFGKVLVAEVPEKAQAFVSFLGSVRDKLGELGGIFSGVLTPMKNFASEVSNAFSGFDLGSFLNGASNGKWSSMMGGLGKAFDRMFKIVSKRAITFSDWQKILEKLIPKIEGFVKSFAPFEFVSSVIEDIKSKFTELQGSLGGSLENAIGVIGHHLERLVNFLLSVRNLFVELIAEKGIDKWFESIGDSILGFLDGLKQPVAAVSGALRDFVDLVGRGASSALEYLSSAVAPLVGLIENLASSFSDLIGSGVSSFLETLFPESFASSVDSAEESLEGFSESASGVADGLRRSPLSTFIGNLQTPFEKFSRILDEGPAHLGDWRELLEGVGNAFSTLFDELKPIETVSGAMKAFFDSMSGFGTIEFSGLGGLVGDNSGVAKLLDSVSKAASDLFGTIRSNLPTVDQLKDGINKVSDKLADMLQSLQPVAEFIGKAFADAIQNGIDLLQSFVDYIGKMDLGADAMGLFGSIGETISEFLSSFSSENLPNIDDVLEFVKGIGEAIGDFVSNVLPKLQGAGDDISKALGGFEGFKIIGDIVGNIVGVFDKANPTLERTADSIEKMSASTERPISLLSRSMGSLSDSVSHIGDTIEKAEDVFEKKGGGLGGALEAFAESANSGIEKALPLTVAVAFGYRLFTLSKTVSDGIQSIGGVMEEATSTIKSVGDFFNGLGKNLKKKGTALGIIRDIVLELVALMAALYILSTVDSESLKNALLATGALFAMIVAVAALSVGLSKYINKINPLAFDAMGAAMLALAGSVLILAVAVKMLSGLKFEDIGAGIAVVAGGLVAMVAAAAIMSRAVPTMFKVGAGMLLLALALAVFGAEIVIFSQLNLLDVAQGIAVVVTALLLFGLVARIAGAGGAGLLKAAAGMMVFSFALLTLLNAIYVLDDVDWGSLGEGLLAVVVGMVVMGVLAGALSGASAGIIAASVAMIAASVALMIVAAAMNVLAMVDSNRLEELSLKMAELIIVFLGALAVFMMFTAFAPSAAIAVGAIVAMTVALIAMTGCLVILTGVAQVAGPALMDAVSAIVILMGAFLLFGAIASIGPVGAGLIVLAATILALNVALVIGAFGFTLIIGALSVLVSIAVPAADAISQAMTTLGEAFSQQAGAIVGLVAAAFFGGVALIVFGAGCLVAAVGVFALSMSLGLVVSMFGGFIQAVTGFDFSSIGFEISGGLAKGIGDGLGSLGDALGTAGKTIFDAVTSIPDFFSGAAEETQASSEELAKAATEPMDEIAEKSEETATSTSEAWQKSLGDNGDMLSMFTDGFGGIMDMSSVNLEDMTAMFENGGVDISSAFGEGFDLNGVTAEQLASLTSGGEDGMAQLQSVLGLGGQNSAQAFGEGLSSTSDIAAKEMNETRQGVESVDLKATGTKKGRDVVDGYKSGASGSKAVGIGASNNLKDGVNSVNVYAAGYSTGQSVGDGIIAGIQSKLAAIRAAGAAAGNAGPAGAKSKEGADQNSPSKKTIPVGEGIAEGLILGMTRMKGQVEAAGGDLGNRSALAVQSALDIANKVDWDAQPTIRPVLDTSDVLAGFQSIDSMFAQRSAMRVAGFAASGFGVGGFGAMTSNTSSNDTYTFNLNYEAGTDVNAFLLTLGEQLRRSNAMRGRR